MKKFWFFAVIFLFTGAFFALNAQDSREEKTANVRNNWLSLEVFYLGNNGVSISNFGIRYERMLSSKMSLNFYGGYNSFTLSGTKSKFYETYETEILFRFYPWGKTFFLGLGAGCSYCDSFSIILEGFHFTIVPEIGWKIDVGQPGGFFMMPCITIPIMIDNRFGGSGEWWGNFFPAGRTFYFGLGWAF